MKCPAETCQVLEIKRKTAGLNTPAVDGQRLTTDSRYNLALRGGAFKTCLRAVYTLAFMVRASFQKWILRLESITLNSYRQDGTIGQITPKS